MNDIIKSVDNYANRRGEIAQRDMTQNARDLIHRSNDPVIYTYLFTFEQCNDTDLYLFQ